MNVKTTLCEHYQNYFYTQKANTPDLMKQAYHVRYQVYCEELKKLSPNSENELQESDSWDGDAVHALLVYKQEKIPIGNIRIIPLNDAVGNKLPIELYYQTAFDLTGTGIKNLRNGKVGEVSRMAILSRFRRRSSDSDYSFNDDNRNLLSENRRLSTNFLPLYLTFAGLGLILEHPLDYCVALMEPCLAKLLVRFGIELNQIGPAINHFGIRAPFLILPEKSYKNLTTEYRSLFNIIRSELTNS